jgi:hypothetical protein
MYGRDNSMLSKFGVRLLAHDFTHSPRTFLAMLPEILETFGEKSDLFPEVLELMNTSGQIPNPREGKGCEFHHHKKNEVCSKNKMLRSLFDLAKSGDTWLFEQVNFMRSFAHIR